MDIDAEFEVILNPSHRDGFDIQISAEKLPAPTREFSFIEGDDFSCEKRDFIAPFEVGRLADGLIREKFVSQLGPPGCQRLILNGGYILCVIRVGTRGTPGRRT